MGEKMALGSEANRNAPGDGISHGKEGSSCRIHMVVGVGTLVQELCTVFYSTASLFDLEQIASLIGDRGARLIFSPSLLLFPFSTWLLLRTTFVSVTTSFSCEEKLISPAAS